MKKMRCTTVVFSLSCAIVIANGFGRATAKELAIDASSGCDIVFILDSSQSAAASFQLQLQFASLVVNSYCDAISNGQMVRNVL